MDREFAAAVEAVRTGDEDAVWAALDPVVRDPAAGEYAIARLHDPDPAIRQAACDLLGRAAEVTVTIRPAAVDALLAITDPPSAESLVWALGRTADVRVLPRILTFITDPDKDVRLAVAGSLPTLANWNEPEPAELLDALIVLSRDPDDDVRNWATFGLARQLTADGPEIRAALRDRTTDPFQDAREEGVCGLARRRDPHGIALLRDLLAEDDLQVGVFAVAAQVGDPSYGPLLEKFEGIGVAEALRQCDPTWQAARDDFAWRLLHAVAAARPDLEPTLYCERFEPGMTLSVTAGDYSIDQVIDRTSGNVDRAVDHVITSSTVTPSAGVVAQVGTDMARLGLHPPRGEANR